MLNDVKFTLSEFLRSGDEEYLNLMSKSLGLKLDSNQYEKINGQAVNEVHTKVYEGVMI